MYKTLWEMPEAPTAIIKGPIFKQLSGHKCALVFTIESDSDNNEKIITILFSDVEMYKCTYMASCSEYMIESYGKIVSVENSSLNKEIENRYNKRMQRIIKNPKIFQHLMIYFDDGPCYEFICTDFKVEENLENPDQLF